MINPFAWIASRVRASVVQGFTEGLNDIGALTDQSIDPHQALTNLNNRLALTAPKENTEEIEGSSRKKKASV